MADIKLTDDSAPIPLLRPATVAELGQIIHEAATDNTALFPLGGRTQLHLGCRPDLSSAAHRGLSTDPGHGLPLKALAVETLALDKVIDYPARDMTITVQVGITIARLQKILAPENQTLPIDVPHADRATLGGILATNTSGARRLGYGSLRDYLLGFSAINDEGQEFKAGGRVVKNVAGYDLCKLMIGSFGTLGILTQATLKLKPLPEERSGVTVGCELDQLDRVLARLHESRTRPVCLELLNPSAAAKLFRTAELEVSAAPWIVLIGFEGTSEAVHWQVQQLASELRESAPQAHIGDNWHKLCQALVEFPAQDEAAFSLKANLLPSGLAEFCGAIGSEPMLQSHAGNGIVLGHFFGDMTKERAVSILNSWRELAAKFQGSVIVTRCPAGWQSTAFVWGPGRGDAGLMRAVKEKFDPRRLFNPGRFVEGI